MCPRPGRRFRHERRRADDDAALRPHPCERPAAEASQWWEKNIPGGRRITEAPNRIMYGAVRLMFLGATSTGGSDGSVIEHLGFSVPDLDATLRALAAIDTKVIDR